MTVVAIHQPNYLPWLGYFRKIALADVFVFLDDVQFPKNSYTNRVRILGNGQARWLSVPVAFHLGDTVRAVHPARADWSAAHLDTLKTFYREAPAFDPVWPDVEAYLRAAPKADIAGINRGLIEAISGRLGLSCRFLASSDLNTGEATGDDRLVRIVSDLAPGGTYLSGAGADKYQDPGKFEAAGIALRYSGFQHPTYDQGVTPFVAGLSVLDAAFRLGWQEVAGLLAAETETV